MAITVDGHHFASKAEARRYGALRLLERAGVISGLTLQPEYKIVHHGELLTTYRADFAYVSDGVRIVEDVKSPATKTPVYRLKKKLVKAFLGVEIVEVA